MHGNTGRVISDVSQHEMVFESFHLSLQYFFLEKQLWLMSFLDSSLITFYSQTAFISLEYLQRTRTLLSFKYF